MIAKYFIDFIVFSFLGWVYECIYCTIRTKHWQNRGFLFGPVCPIYGSAAVAGMIIFGRLPVFAGTFVPAWKIFLISAVASAVLEFVTSWILEKLFHAVWWDYSEIPLNIQGRISLPTTTGFGLAGIFIVRWVIPFVEKLQYGISTVAGETVSLILMAFLAADLALTVASLTQLLANIETAQTQFNERMESGYQLAQRGPKAVGAHMAEAARTAGVQAVENAKTAAESAGKKAKDRILETRREMAKLASSATGRLSNKDLHHISNMSVFRKYKDKAPVLKLRDALAGFLASKQSPVFKEKAVSGSGQQDTDHEKG